MLPRSADYTPSELVYTPGKQANSISELKEKWKPNWYLTMIKILSGLLAIVISVTIREFVSNKELMTSVEQMQLAVIKANKIQKLLSSKQLNYILDFCDFTTLSCSHCLPEWKEHASRCFFLSHVNKTWENARRECLSYKGDLAIIQNAEDQAFLTNLTSQVKKGIPDDLFHSAWIGLQDMVKEGSFFWVNGDKLKLDLRFWRPGEPNNAIAAWDTDRAGQDCVSILPSNEVGLKGWMNSWDDITCFGKRHYICETDALILA